MLVIKENAYGCGQNQILDISYQLGFRFYCVTKNYDATRIVSRYDDVIVLILGKEKMISSTKRIFLTVEDESDFDYCRKNKMPFHYKIKSRMNRFGGVINEQIIKDSLCLGIYSHIGYYEVSRIKEELARFKTKISIFDHKLVHIGGSHLIGIENRLNLRVGMAIYNNSVYIKGNIVKTFKLKRNESIGYNDSYVAKKDITVGIIDVGYNSGLSSILFHRCYIKGNYYKTIGIKCMDFCFVEINDKIEVGDETEFLGPHISIEELERIENKSRYELYVNLK